MFIEVDNIGAQEQVTATRRLNLCALLLSQFPAQGRTKLRLPRCDSRWRYWPAFSTTPNELYLRSIDNNCGCKVCCAAGTDASVCWFMVIGPHSLRLSESWTLMGTIKRQKTVAWVSQGREGNLNFVHAASMADGTQRVVNARSCLLFPSICSRQDATPFWWECHMKRLPIDQGC